MTGPKNRILLLYAFHVFARAGVDSDRFAFVDEHGYLNFNARFEFRSLRGVRRGIARYARFGFGYEKLSQSTEKALPL